MICNCWPPQQCLILLQLLQQKGRTGVEETKEKERKEKEKEKMKEEQQQQQEQDGRRQLGTGWCTRRYCVKLLRCMRPDSESNE
mmetsp:Transcript_85633/g.138856  ORF Transcript_85633/g.138856 Transcript_85633/m.138856 type:complete len:84 (+) Transcript_85633:817-1068(+)